MPGPSRGAIKDPRKYVQVRKLLRSGISARTAARVVGVTKRTANRWANRLGLVPDVSDQGVAKRVQAVFRAARRLPESARKDLERMLKESDVDA